MSHKQQEIEKQEATGNVLGYIANNDLLLGLESVTDVQ